MKIKILSLILSLCFVFSSSLQAQTFKSSVYQTALLELFTSEGCSSCPPAERWFSDLEKSPTLWKDFVPVVSHVTYWDYLGWKDRFANIQYDTRQSVYTRGWGGRTVYTPGITLNAKEWRSWRNGTKPKPTYAEVGALSVEVKDDHYLVKFKPASEGEGRFEVHGALLGFGIVSEVTAGENHGKILEHDFVSLDTTLRPLSKEGDHYEAQVILAKPEEIEVARYGIAVWVTKHRDHEPIQATGGYLN